MDADAIHIIDTLGGTSEVAKLVKTAPSTVHSWRKGIPESRLDHIELAAQARGKADELARAKCTLPSLGGGQSAAAFEGQPDGSAGQSA